MQIFGNFEPGSLKRVHVLLWSLCTVFCLGATYVYAETTARGTEAPSLRELILAFMTFMVSLTGIVSGWIKRRERRVAQTIGVVPGQFSAALKDHQEAIDIIQDRVGGLEGKVDSLETQHQRSMVAFHWQLSDQRIEMVKEIAKAKQELHEAIQSGFDRLRGDQATRDKIEEARHTALNENVRMLTNAIAKLERAQMPRKEGL